MSMTAFVLELVLLVVLIAAALLCWRVDRRLRALREGQDGLRDTVRTLDEAVERARASLAALDRASRGAGVELQDQVREARALADELRLLTDAGERSAGRLAQARRRPEGERKPHETAPRRAPSPSGPLDAVR